VYDRLFKVAQPDTENLTQDINPNSLLVHDAVVEPAICVSPEKRFQFERQGYFCRDGDAFNRTVTLRDSWK
jgi:glutaminyl-tRNA synthetase